MCMYNWFTLLCNRNQHHVVKQLLLFGCICSLQPHGLQHTRFTCPGNGTVSQSLLKLMSIESVMPSNQLILCHPHLLLPSIFPSIRVFPSDLALHIRWPKYWSFSISPSSEYSGLLSFRIDLFDRLAVKETLKSPPIENFIHVNPWLVHVNVWQKPLQYCKVISLQLIKINFKN